MRSLIAELKRRRVFRAGGLYVVAGWVVIQVATTVLPVFELPAWTARAVVILVALGFPVVLVLSWIYDISSRGLRQVLVAGGAGVLVLGALGFTIVATTRRLDSLPPLVPGRVTHITTAAGLELDPALSPDGRTIAYTAGPPGGMRIYVQSVAGGQAVPLAQLLDERWPQWSPDGARIVFHTGAQELDLGPAVQSTSIYTVPTLGGVPRALTTATSPGFSAAWSPDGRQLASARQRRVRQGALDHAGGRRRGAQARRRAGRLRPALVAGRLHARVRAGQSALHIWRRASGERWTELHLDRYGGRRPRSPRHGGRPHQRQPGVDA